MHALAYRCKRTTRLASALLCHSTKGFVPIICIRCRGYGFSVFSPLLCSPSFTSFRRDSTGQLYGTPCIRNEARSLNTRNSLTKSGMLDLAIGTRPWPGNDVIHRFVLPKPNRDRDLTSCYQGLVETTSRYETTPRYYHFRWPFAKLLEFWSIWRERQMN